MTYLIGFSGPPRAGKDTIAQELQFVLAERHPSLHVVMAALSTPLREATYTLGGMLYTREHYEAQKDVPQTVFNGATIRGAMIALAEGHVRRTYGVEFFARSLLNRELGKEPDLIIVTDVGFEEEVSEFIVGVGREKCCFPQIVRPGCDFTNDSRSYVGTMLGTSIINDGSPTMAARRLYGRLMNQFSWNLG